MTVGMQPDGFCAEDSALGDAIGSVWLGRHRGELEVSYTFLPLSWGQGFAFEAVSALLAWTWLTYADPSVIAVTQTENYSSRRLLERLGFQQEREFTEFAAPQTQFRLVRPT
jgi:[ribosomal protein S5]-alanine N-acetyltransferase